MILRPQIVYPSEQALSGVSFQSSSYLQPGLVRITRFPSAGRFLKEVPSSGIKYNCVIRICYNKFSFV